MIVQEQTESSSPWAFVIGGYLIATAALDLEEKVNLFSGSYPVAIHVILGHFVFTLGDLL